MCVARLLGLLRVDRQRPRTGSGPQLAEHAMGSGGLQQPGPGAFVQWPRRERPNDVWERVPGARSATG